MTCLEAQTKIMAFIDNKLTDEELYDFVRHIKHCQNCSEELEIYYTLLVGMKQLDNNENLSVNFKKDLDRKIEDTLHRINQTNKLRKSSVAIFALLFVGVGVFAYNNFLGWVYNSEQELKRSRQSEYYYYDTFGAYIFDENRIRIREITVSVETELPDKTAGFYQKVHHYNVTQTLIENEAENGQEPD